MITETSYIVQVDKWTIHEMELSKEKVSALWEILQRYKTIFSDITKMDPGNFVQAITSPESMWFEVREHDILIGIIWFGDMHQVVDCTAQMVFFDRRPAEKLEVCRAMMKWMFRSFPIHRITVTPPAIYHAVIRLLEKLGFKREGCKREAVLMGGKWNDQLIYGLTRTEVELT